MTFCGTIEGMDRFDHRQFEDVDATQEMIDQRIIEWLDQFQVHPGELILTHDDRKLSVRHSDWDLHAGVILDELDRAELTKLREGLPSRQVTVSGTPIIWANNRDLGLHDTFPVKLGGLDAIYSYQKYTNALGPVRGVNHKYPAFEVVIGNQAVAEWFNREENASRRYQYFEICMQLGVEPVPSPELDEALMQRRNQVEQELVNNAARVIDLDDRIKSAYDSVGDGFVVKGGAIQARPESVGMAKVMTHRSWRDREFIKRDIEKLKAEYQLLGGSEQHLGQVLVELFGLRLESADQE